MNQSIQNFIDECCKQTRLFWDTKAGLKSDFAEFYRAYISELLPQELELAKEDGRLRGAKKLPAGQCDVLVLLVGYSFEPLLQAICAYNPAEIVLVLNDAYDEDKNNTSGAEMHQRLSGAEMYRRLEVLLPLLKSRVGVRAALRPLKYKGRAAIGKTIEPLNKDSPSDVFRFLLAQLKSDWKENKRIVIDITGAKKSMVAGAFFFAAYSNTPISYVDFTRYAPQYGRPYGCTCVIDLIDNPYRDFYLRDWGQARRLYEKYAFAAARQALEEIIYKMDRSGFFSVEGSHQESPEIQACQRLLAAVKVYEAWDNGDFHGAAEIVNKAAAQLPPTFLKQGLPWAVEALQGWPHAAEGCSADQAAKRIRDAHFDLKYGVPEPENSIFGQPKALMAYVHDELAKVERLIQPKEEYRAAYLRAIGLDEFLLKARLAMCWLNEAFTRDNRPVTRLRLGSTEWRRWFKILADHDGFDAMRRALLHVKSLKLNDQDPNNQETIYLELPPSAPELKPYWARMALDWEKEQDHAKRSMLARLRGEAIHTYLYLSREIARAAFDLTAESVKEFEQNWLGQYHRDDVLNAKNGLVCVPDWKDICDWCGIDFLPPYKEESV